MNRLVFIFALIVIAQPGLAQTIPYPMRVDQLEKKVEELNALVLELQGRLTMVEVQIKRLEKQAGSASLGENSTGSPSEDEQAEDEQAGDPTGPETGWLVRITSNVALDNAEVRSQLQAARASLTTTQKYLHDARETLQNELNPKAWDYHRDKPQKPNQQAVNKARETVSKLEKQEEETNRVIQRLERELQDSTDKRVINGATSDGQVVHITAGGQAGAVAKTLTVGRWYRITGTGGKVIKGAVRINMKSAALEDPPLAQPQPSP
jgi:hypothetical protein